MESMLDPEHQEAEKGQNGDTDSQSVSEDNSAGVSNTSIGKSEERNFRVVQGKGDGQGGLKGHPQGGRQGQDECPGQGQGQEQGQGQGQVQRQRQGLGKDHGQGQGQVLQMQGLDRLLPEHSTFSGIMQNLDPEMAKNLRPVTQQSSHDIPYVMQGSPQSHSPSIQHFKYQTLDGSQLVPQSIQDTGNVGAHLTAKHANGVGFIGRSETSSVGNPFNSIGGSSTAGAQQAMQLQTLQQRQRAQMILQAQRRASIALQEGSSQVGSNVQLNQLNQYHGQQWQHQPQPGESQHQHQQHQHQHKHQHLHHHQPQQQEQQQEQQQRQQQLQLQQQNIADVSDRNIMVSRIIQLLQDRKPHTQLDRLNTQLDRLSKLPHVARRLEDSLYRSARSREEYNDQNNLKARLQQLALSMGPKKDTRKLDTELASGGSQTSTQYLQGTESLVGSMPIQQQESRYLQGLSQQGHVLQGLGGGGTTESLQSLRERMQPSSHQGAVSGLRGAGSGPILENLSFKSPRGNASGNNSTHYD
ncbi:unnamed protein product, partial [Discosporangium mesarthrocarpum]